MWRESSLQKTGIWRKVLFLAGMGEHLFNDNSVNLTKVILYHLQDIVDECPNASEAAIWLLFACQPHQGLSLDMVINIDEATSFCK